jgi:thiamine biosynthesis lipoprotein
MLLPTAVPHRHVEHCMGTVFSIDVRAPGVDPNAVQDVVRLLHWVDRTFSTYRPDSQISRLRRGTIKLAECAPEVAEVLARCAELAEETDGYFDCRFAGALDPSGYAKGWAIERAADVLAAAGSANHCVNGGGDVQCVGSAAPGRPWRVGITDPLRAGRLVGSVAGHRLAVATSGTAERGLHIVDPHAPLRPSAYASITVVGTALGDIDAYATAAIAMGEGAPDWLRSRGLTALLVAADGNRTSIGARETVRPAETALFA